MRHPKSARMVETEMAFLHHSIKVANDQLPGLRHEVSFNMALWSVSWALMIRSEVRWHKSARGVKSKGDLDKRNFSAGHFLLLVSLTNKNFLFLLESMCTWRHGLLIPHNQRQARSSAWMSRNSQSTCDLSGHLPNTTPCQSSLQSGFEWSISVHRPYRNLRLDHSPSHSCRAVATLIGRSSKG